MIFSVQNLITEPPFSRLDLVSCRNVLIYLEPEIQRRIITLFSFALRPGGYLFLGKADGIAGQNELFATLSPKWRIYGSRGPPQRAVENFLLWPEKKRRPAVAWERKAIPRSTLPTLTCRCWPSISTRRSFSPMKEGIFSISAVRPANTWTTRPARLMLIC